MTKLGGKINLNMPDGLLRRLNEFSASPQVLVHSTQSRVLRKLSCDVGADLDGTDASVPNNLAG